MSIFSINVARPATPLSRLRIVLAAMALVVGMGAVVTSPAAADPLPSGWAVAWGSGPALGDGTGAMSTVPVAVAGGALAGKTITDVSAGDSHTCAIADGTTYCWGGGVHGRLGDGSGGDTSAPVAVSTSVALAGKTLVKIAAGGLNTCAIDSEGKAYCWGYGPLGDGNSTGAGSLVPVAVDTSGALHDKALTTITISSGFGGNTTCALDSTGTAYCWGAGNVGQLGNGNTVSAFAPVAVNSTNIPAGRTLTSITAGGAQICALDSAGAAYCWGQGADGQLGNNSTNDSSVPVAVDTSGVLAGRTLTSISAAQGHACAVDSSGKAYCWGLNDRGQLGNNSTTTSLVPVAVDTSGALAGRTLTSITTGPQTTSHTCALDSVGLAYCWGWGGYGELGIGSTASSLTPVAVSTSGILAGTSLTMIDTGGSHTVALSGGQIIAVPQPPTGVTGTRGNTTVSVSWTAPADDGGSPILEYTATASPGGAHCTTSGATSCTVTGLTNGTGYTFTVTARNAVGISAASAPSATVTPATVPQPPTGVTGTRGNTTVSVSWTAPADTGGSPILEYTATASPGGRYCTTSGTTSCTVTGLTNGTGYTFTVTARNAVGISAASAPSATVTPAAVPQSPTGVTGTRGNTTVSVSWSAPADTGGSPILGTSPRRARVGRTARRVGRPVAR